MECWSDNKAVIALAFVEMVRRRTSARKKRTAYAALGAAPAKHGGGWVILVLGALVVVNLYVFVWDGRTGVRALKEQAEAKSAPTLTVPAAALAPVAEPTAPQGASLSREPGSGDRAPTHAPVVVVPSALVAPTPTTAVAAPTAPAAARAIDGKVGKSDTLGRLLKHNGLTAAETDEIIRALSGALDFRTIRAGQSFRIERGGDGRVTRFDLEIGKGRHVRAERQPSGELKAITDTT
jgi:hypothetical protein